MAEHQTTFAEMPKFLGRMIPVPKKLLREAHAVMRQCGWQWAPAVDDGSDGVLALAAAEVEEAFGNLLNGSKP